MNTKFMALVATLAIAKSSAAYVIDFEDLSAGTIVDNEYSAQGVVISALNFDNNLDLAVIFDTENPTGGDHDLGGPFTAGPDNDLGSIAPGNVLILQENDNCDALSCTTPDDEGSRPGGQFIIEFDQAVSLNSIDFFDVEVLETDPAESNRISLFDANGDLIALDFFTPNTGGDNQWARAFFGVDGVSRIEINMGGSGAIDNIDVTVVPVPAALPLFLAALGGLGFMRKR
ncbi:MAG: PEP-CTERM sorting domain-containing protein [Gammaproteobacteria bacterium]